MSNLKIKNINKLEYTSKPGDFRSFDPLRLLINNFDNMNRNFNNNFKAQEELEIVFSANEIFPGGIPHWKDELGLTCSHLEEVQISLSYFVSLIEEGDFFNLLEEFRLTLQNILIYLHNHSYPSIRGELRKVVEAIAWLNYVNENDSIPENNIFAASPNNSISSFIKKYANDKADFYSKSSDFIHFVGDYTENKFLLININECFKYLFNDENSYNLEGFSNEVIEIIEWAYNKTNFYLYQIFYRHLPRLTEPYFSILSMVNKLRETKKLKNAQFKNEDKCGFSSIKPLDEKDSTTRKELDYIQKKMNNMTKEKLSESDIRYISILLLGSWLYHDRNGRITNQDKIMDRMIDFRPISFLIGSIFALKKIEIHHIEILQIVDDIMNNFIFVGKLAINGVFTRLYYMCLKIYKINPKYPEMVKFIKKDRHINIIERRRYLTKEGKSTGHVEYDPQEFLTDLMKYVLEIAKAIANEDNIFKTKV